MTDPHQTAPPEPLHQTAPPEPQIELGVYHYQPEDDLAAGPPQRRWPDRADWLRAARRGRAAVALGWRPALLVAALFGLIAGAVVPAGPALIRVWTVAATGDQVSVISGETLYVMTGPGPEWVLRAYRLEDGAVRWESALVDEGDWVDLAVVDGVPLVTVPRPGSFTAVTALDPETGAERWSQWGWPQASLAGDRTRILLARPIPAAFPVDDGTWPGDGARPYRLVAVDLGSGAEAWRRTLGTGERIVGVAGEVTALAHLLTLREDGRLVRYDAATGEEAAQVGTPPVGDGQALLGSRAHLQIGSASVRVTPVSGFADATMAAGEVVLPVPDGLAAYDPVTLARRWRVSLPGYAWAVPCGSLVCAFADTDGVGVLYGVDPATGRHRWSLPCDRSDQPVRNGCAFLQPAVTDGVLLVRRVTMDDRRATSVTWGVDAGTGEVVGRLPGWAAYPAGAAAPAGVAGGWLAGFAEPERTDRSADDPDAPADDPERSWLVRWRSASTGFEVRGPIDAQWCQPPVGEHVVCWSAARERLEVWRAG